MGVRRKRRRFPVGGKPTRRLAPAGSNRSSHGGDEMAEAFGIAGLRHRYTLSARAHGSTHVGVVPLQPFAKAEAPAYSDLEVDPVRPKRAPCGDPAIGGDHHAVDEAGTAEPVEADAQIRLLHD